MTRLIIKITLVLFIATIFIFPSISFTAAKESENLELPKSVINPGSFYYPFKRFWEKGLEKIQFSDNSRISLGKSLLKTRLAELKNIVDNEILSEVQRSSERFAYQAGVLTQLVTKNDDEKKKIIEAFNEYTKFLEKLKIKFPADSSFRMLIQHDINTLEILSNSLK